MLDLWPQLLKGLSGLLTPIRYRHYRTMLKNMQFHLKRCNKVSVLRLFIFRVYMCYIFCLLEYEIEFEKR